MIRSQFGRALGLQCHASKNRYISPTGVSSFKFETKSRNLAAF